MLRELRVIDSVASFIQFAVATDAYSLDNLTQAMPITQLLQNCYKLLTVLVKVRRSIRIRLQAL